MRSVATIHAAATLFMVGVIWFVQVVHYPLLEQVAAQDFGQYEEMHRRLATWVLAPPMLLELVAALVLLWTHPPGGEGAKAWTGFALLAVIWLSTLLLQMPQHNLLLHGFDADVLERLIDTNWIRTGAWSLRGLLALSMLRHA